MKKPKLGHTTSRYKDRPAQAIGAAELRSPSLVQHAITAQTVQQSDITIEAVGILKAHGVLNERRARAIIECDPTKQFHLVCGSCGSLASVRAAGCGSRLCQHCSKKKRAKLFNRLRDVFSTFDTLRFLTLGFKNTTSIDREYFIKCQRQFHDMVKRLSRAKHPKGCYCGRCDEGRKNIKGYRFGTYVNVLEVKVHHEGDPRIASGTEDFLGLYETTEYNAHYHTLFDGDYIPQAVIQQCFSDATKGESYIVYIKAPAYGRPITFRKAALSYVCKYLGKIEGIKSAEELAQFYIATEKIRFYNVGWKKEDRPKPQKMKLTCAHCNAQNWITSYSVGGEIFSQLCGDREPDPEGVYLAPALPIPVINIDDNEKITITYDDMTTQERIAVRNQDIVAYCTLPQHISAIGVHFMLEEEELRERLEALRNGGQLMELKPDIYMRP